MWDIFKPSCVLGDHEYTIKDIHKVLRQSMDDCENDQNKKLGLKSMQLLQNATRQSVCPPEEMYRPENSKKVEMTIEYVKRALPDALENAGLYKAKQCDYILFCSVDKWEKSEIEEVKKAIGCKKRSHMIIPRDRATFVNCLRTILSDEVPHKNILILQSEMWSQEGSRTPKKGKEIEWLMKCCLFSDCVACTICRHRDGSMTEVYQMFCCVCKSRGKSVHLREECMSMKVMDGREDREYHPWTGKLKNNKKIANCELVFANSEKDPIGEIIKNQELEWKLKPLWGQWNQRTEEISMVDLAAGTSKLQHKIFMVRGGGPHLYEELAKSLSEANLNVLNGFENNCGNMGSCTIAYQMEQHWTKMHKIVYVIETGEYHKSFVIEMLVLNVEETTSQANLDSEFKEELNPL